MSTTTMPRLGLGTWEQTGEGAVTAIRTALDLGYRHIDTAQMYGNEAQVGEAVAASGVDRDDLWLTTKLDNGNHAAADVVASVEESLRELRTDHVDLLLVHWPVELDVLEETLEAMNGLKDRQLVRHTGVSNFTVDQIRRAAKTAEILTDQVEYHASLDQTPVKEAVRDVGGLLTAYSPLARGSLLEDQAVREVAEARGASPAQVALRWLLDQDDVAVIPKASSEAHLRSNLETLDMAPLDDDERQRLDALPKDRRVIDPPFAPDWD